MRKSFIIHIDSLSILDEMDDNQAGKLFKAIKSFQVGETFELDFAIKMAFIPFKNQFERDKESYKKIVERNQANGLNGGRPVGNNKTEKTQSVKSKPKKADSKNDNKSDSVNEIVNYLNTMLGTKYNPGSVATSKHIIARLNENYSVADFIRVIDIKVPEWGSDPKMKIYLRPETLFGSKFESYLNQQSQSSPSVKKLYEPEW